MGLSVNRDALRQLGLNVKSDAAEYLKEISNIYSINDEVKTVWQGTEREHFTSAVEEYRTSMNSLGDAINDYGQCLVDASRDYSRMSESIIDNVNRL